MKPKNQKLRPQTQSLNCSECGERRDNVGGDTVKIICWKCVINLMKPQGGTK
jgi:hypothetical protein